MLRTESTIQQKTSNWKRGLLRLSLLRLSLFIIGLMGGIFSSLAAKDLGCFGETFEIAEESILELIQERLNTQSKKGNLEQHILALQKHAGTSALHPQPVTGLKSATITRIFTYDPSITLTKNLTDEKGKVLVKKGVHFNPLDTVSLSKPLIFFNGDDERQKRWVIKYYSKAKLILVKGSPQQLEQDWRLPIYFDQGGKLTSQLKIRAVPACVSQNGKVLEIQEVALQEWEKRK